jgi:hypothetical protein
MSCLFAWRKCVALETAGYSSSLSWFPGVLSGLFRRTPAPVVALILATCTLPAATAATGADEGVDAFTPLGARYEQEIRPLLKSYCLGCHSTEKKKGELDLERFGKFADLRRDPATWQQVRAFVVDGEMPPEGKRQPSSEERQRLLAWIDNYLVAEANASAGDPGPVVLRRLSNAEYTYTLRDLTGLGDLDPAREFPTDGAAGEGFTNAGEALVMSPALVSKYLEAGKKVASHAVLLPDGIRFFPGATRPDWSSDLLSQIQGFYDVYTSGEVSQGALARWRDANASRRAGYEDGRVDLTPMLAALLRRRSDVQGRSLALRDLAGEEQVNGKYFERIAEWLRSTEPQSALANRIREHWQSGTATDAPALAEEIRGWQETLWQFNTVGHLGLIRPWQVPASPVAATHSFKVPLGKPQGGVVTVHFAARPVAREGQGVVEWSRPRLERAEQPTRLLRNVRGATMVFSGASEEIPAREAAESHVLRVPSVVAVRLPAEQVAEYDLVVDARLVDFSHDVAVQLYVTVNEPPLEGLYPAPRRKILAREEGHAAQELEAAFRDFRDVFPASMCYARIVPVDEVVTVVVYHREDDQLARLMLGDTEEAQLDKLWKELHYVSRDAFQLVASLEHELEYATQDADPKRFHPLQEPIDQLAASLRRELRETEPAHVDVVLEFAGRAYRRPLKDTEKHGLRALYHSLRAQELPHEDSIRLTLARVLASPTFLYRAEMAPPGESAAPVSDFELATRLSYFLWSSAPDAELWAEAAAGRLRETGVLLGQARRMLKDDRTRRLATEFACQWLNIYAFDEFDEKSEAYFPEFASLRGPMHEEAIRFFTDLFQEDRSILSMLDADHTFVNGRLATHYGIAGVAGEEWRRVEGLEADSRGGILGFAATLARQSGASRTSPILRGNWVFESLLGEHLPRPPPNVPQLPATAPDGLTERQLIERHSSDPACAKCHARIDPYGFALEGFDAIGRYRETDTAGLAIETRAKLPDGQEVDGLAGLRGYLLGTRRRAFVRQFCRKLLGYGLGRAVQLSDEPLLARMARELAEKEWRFHVAVEAIVRSRQFREIRGADFE